MFLIVVMTLAGAAGVARRDGHIRIEYFYEGGSILRRRRLRLLAAAATALAFLALACSSAPPSPTRSAGARPRWAWACRAGGSRWRSRRSAWRSPPAPRRPAGMPGAGTRIPPIRPTTKRRFDRCRRSADDRDPACPPVRRPDARRRADRGGARPRRHGRDRAANAATQWWGLLAAPQNLLRQHRQVSAAGACRCSCWSARSSTARASPCGWSISPMALRRPRPRHAAAGDDRWWRCSSAASPARVRPTPPPSAA